jgi:GGDEF domain-containing protein
MPAAPLGRRRPRPVADVPALDGREVARAWLVELVAAAPLERAAALPGPAFASSAPQLCGGVVAALASDAALDDLEPGGALAPLAGDAAAMAGADGAAEAVASLEALRAVVWALLLESLHRPAPSLVADLADRLAATVAAVAAAALEGGRGPAVTARPGDRGPLAAILREPEEEVAPAPAAAPASPFPARGPTVEDAADFHSRVAPWTAAVERQLERHATGGAPFALLCLEVADLDRLVAAERDGDVALALEAAEAGVSAQLRPADVLVRERPGRYWLVAPDTDGDGARSLAHLLGAAVAGVRGHRGAPLEAAVGVATCPRDGTDAPTLEGRAEEGLFAARAAGVRVTAPRRD